MKIPAARASAIKMPDGARSSRSGVVAMHMRRMGPVNSNLPGPGVPRANCVGAKDGSNIDG